MILSSYTSYTTFRCTADSLQPNQRDGLHQCAFFAVGLNSDLGPSNVFAATRRIVGLGVAEHLMVWKLVNLNKGHKCRDSSEEQEVQRL